ncbi:MAG: THUMP domain-containing protein, partial [Chloroflexota bacterium]|nr:THUMP domain-containing protein [Chloroflexota bacterium]
MKTHELALKGKNRPWFMRKLTDNLRAATKGSGVEKVWKGQLMVGLTLSDEECWPEVKSRIKEVFGVAKFYKAYELPQDLDGLKASLPKMLEGYRFNSFRITTNRADKRFHMNSEQVNRDLGTFVRDLTGAHVSLKEPELSIHVDIQTKGLLVHFDEVKAHGGLPVGVSGKVA